MINQSSYGNNNDLIRQPEKKQGKMIFSIDQKHEESPSHQMAMVGDLYDNYQQR